MMESKSDLLFERDHLRRHEPAIRTATNDAVTAAELHGVPAELYRYYLVFSEGLAHQVGLGEVDAERAFYNAYYWFERFVRAQIAAHGADSGLEQQAHQLLEYPPFELDPDVMTAITERLERDAVDLA